MGLTTAQNRIPLEVGVRFRHLAHDEPNNHFAVEQFTIY
jgi:hypothetical protein